MLTFQRQDNNCLLTKKLSWMLETLHARFHVSIKSLVPRIAKSQSVVRKQNRKQQRYIIASLSQTVQFRPHFPQIFQKVHLPHLLLQLPKMERELAFARRPFQK